MAVSTRIINCPNCGASIEFRTSAYLPAVCTYCQASIAPPKEQSADTNTKLEQNKPIPTINMPEVQGRESRGVPLKPVAGFLLIAVLGIGTHRYISAMGAKAYYDDMHQKITMLSCADPSINAGSKIRLRFGSFGSETFLTPNNGRYSKTFLNCLNDSTSLGIMKAPKAELILGNVLVKVDAGNSFEPEDSSVSLNRVSATWDVDIHNEQQKRPGLASALDALAPAKMKVWQCWVKHGILERSGETPFNQYTGSNIRVPFRLSVNDQGRITNTFVVNHKSRKEASTWKDQPAFKNCLTEATASISNWPAAIRGENYFVGLQMNVSQSPWK